MQKLYIDFDGVIMSTNDEIDYLLKNSNIDLNNVEEKINFLKTIKWDILLRNSKEISEAFKHIEMLHNSDKFNVSILTHVCSNHEAEEKIKLLNEKIKNLDVIPVPKEHEKCFFVDPKDAILVDDYTKNLELWEENGGIGIKFANKKHVKFKSTYNLGELFDLV